MEKTLESLMPDRGRHDCQAKELESPCGNGESVEAFEGKVTRMKVDFGKTMPEVVWWRDWTGEKLRAGYLEERFHRKNQQG